MFVNAYVTEYHKLKEAVRKKIKIRLTDFQRKSPIVHGHKKVLIN